MLDLTESSLYTQEECALGTYALCPNYISPAITTQPVKYPVLDINVCLCDLSALCKSEL